MRVHVFIPDEVVAEVDALVGKRGRSAYFVDAVRERLRRDGLLAATSRAMGALADVDVPAWETAESTSAWIRGLREGTRPQRAERSA